MNYFEKRIMIEATIVGVFCVGRQLRLFKELFSRLQCPLLKYISASQAAI
jgi:hypothetical protein